MSRHHRERPGMGGICSDCESDLVTRKDGRVYCSNESCPYYGKPHKTGPNPNKT